MCTNVSDKLASIISSDDRAACLFAPHHYNSTTPQSMTTRT